MTLDELKQKDVVNLMNGQLLGRATDLEFCAETGQVTALIVPGGSSMLGWVRGERNALVIPWERIERIGTDVILVNMDENCGLM